MHKFFVYTEAMLCATLDSVEAVIDALGGPAELRRLGGFSPQRVWNWKRDNRFPASTYVLLQGALRKVNRSADDRLWGQAAAAS